MLSTTSRWLVSSAGLVFNEESHLKSSFESIDSPRQLAGSGGWIWASGGIFGHWFDDLLKELCWRNGRVHLDGIKLVKCGQQRRQWGHPSSNWVGGAAQSLAQLWRLNAPDGFFFHGSSCLHHFPIRKKELCWRHRDAHWRESAAGNIIHYRGGLARWKLISLEWVVKFGPRLGAEPPVPPVAGLAVAKMWQPGSIPGKPS